MLQCHILALHVTRGRYPTGHGLRAIRHKLRPSPARPGAGSASCVRLSRTASLPCTPLVAARYITWGIMREPCYWGGYSCLVRPAHNPRYAKCRAGRHQGGGCVPGSGGAKLCWVSLEIWWPSRWLPMESAIRYRDVCINSYLPTHSSKYRIGDYSESCQGLTQPPKIPYQ